MSNMFCTRHFPRSNMFIEVFVLTLLFSSFQQKRQWRRGRKIKGGKRVWVLLLISYMLKCSKGDLKALIRLWCVNVFLQFFEELATDSKPEKAVEVAVKDTQGKQVIFTLEVCITVMRWLMVHCFDKQNSLDLQEMKRRVLCLGMVIENQFQFRNSF